MAALVTNDFTPCTILAKSEPTDQTMGIIVVTPVPTSLTIGAIMATRTPTDHSLCAIVIVKVTTDRTLHNLMATPVPTDLTKSAIKPQNAVALESSSRYGVIASAVVLARHRHTLVNVCKKMNDIE